MLESLDFLRRRNGSLMERDALLENLLMENLLLRDVRRDRVGFAPHDVAPFCASSTPRPFTGRASHLEMVA